MPSKGQPLHRRKQNLQKSRSRFVGNERRQKNSFCIVGNQTPRQSSPGRAREGRNPLAPRRPRECRGAERPTLAPSGKKNLKKAIPASSETNAVKRTALHCRKRTSSKGQPLHCRKRTPSKGHPLHRRKRNLQKSRSRFVGNERRQKNSSCIVGNQTPRQSSPGRAREGRNPLAPRRPRECRGAERPTLTPSGKKNLEKAIPASSETNAVKRTAPASSGTELPARTAPGERERDAPLSHLVARGGVGERSAPRPASSETNAFKRIAPASSETKILARTVSESSRGCEPSRLPIDPGDLCGGIVLIFSEGSLPPGEKIASLQIPRPEIRRISAESEKGWCGGESVPSAFGRAREGRSPLDFQSKGFPQEIVSASHRGWQWRGSLLPRRAAPQRRLIQTSPAPSQTPSVRRSSPPGRVCAPPASSSCRIPSPPTRPEPRPRSSP